MDRIEIITSVERRRRHSLAEKERLVMAAAAPGARIAEIARAAGVDPSLVYRWRRELSIAAATPEEPDAREAPAAFVPVSIAPLPPPPAPAPVIAAPSTITVEFAGGARLKIEGAPEARVLASVIGALSKAAR
ncbi:MAG: hypothetical protein CTY15_13065 [Methylocystis sp.]|nr:MAG: hypothetical protein CTY15_13065 [Methylocystis sp.]